MNKLIILSLMLAAIMADACPNDEYCAQCNGTSCKRCVNSYVDSSGVCQKPTDNIDNCYTYSSASACELCDSGYYLTGNSCEEIKIDNCVEVVSTAPTQCIACDNGNLPSNGSCNGSVSCNIDNCNVCKYSDDSAGTNSSNTDGTNSNGTNADGTNSNGSNADGTNNSGNTSTPICASCDTNYSISSTGNCIKEPTDHCFLAQTDTACTLCSRGYYDNGSNNCKSTNVQGSGAQIFTVLVSVIALLAFL